MNKKFNEVIKNYENSFNSLPEDSIHLSMLDKYIRKGDKLFVHKKTGVVTSELKYNSLEIAKYWSDVIFMSENKEDYSAHFPFAYSRLYYVLRTLKDFLSSANYNNQSIDFCDFATGEGILPKLILKESLDWNISVTETSKALCEKMQHDNFLIYNKNLGLGELPEFKVDVGAICWTLCNCIKPLDVLKEIYDKIKDDGYLIIAESSRILTPFKKSLDDTFQRTHPADAHPYYFSKNSLSAIVKCAGFEPVFINRYLDTSYLVLIAKKTTDTEFNQLQVDNYKDVIDYFQKLDNLTTYFQKIKNI